MPLKKHKPKEIAAKLALHDDLARRADYSINACPKAHCAPGTASDTRQILEHQSKQLSKAA